MYDPQPLAANHATNPSTSIDASHTRSGPLTTSPTSTIDRRRSARQNTRQKDTEAFLGGGVDEAARDRFFSRGLKMLFREVDTPTVVAVQQHFADLPAYVELRPSMLEVTVPVLEDRVIEALLAILARRLEPFGLDQGVEAVIAPAAMPALADFYAETGGSIRHVLAALDVAATAAVDSGDERLQLGHVRLGIEDWRSR